MLDEVYWNNTLRAYLVAGSVTASIFVFVRVLVYLLRKRISKLAQRTKTSLDDAIVKVLGATRSLMTLLVAIYAGSLFLTLPLDVERAVRIVAMVALLVQVGIWLSTAVTAGVTRTREKRVASGDTASLGVLAMLGLFGRILVWVVVFLLVLDNLGVNITALVAGLGIGGIAVALAMQNILSDLFASVSIMLDRPFEVGDTIHVGDLVGTVENIGVKTTRVRSLSGEQVVFANNDLLGSRIRNYKRMHERRSLFVVGVTYQTPIPTLEKIPVVARQIIEQQDRVRFDRAHFRSFGASSLDFELVYYVLSPDYVVYMDTQQRVNFEIMRQLKALGADFAYPTQTVFVNREDAPS